MWVTDSVSHSFVLVTKVRQRQLNRWSGWCSKVQNSLQVESKMGLSWEQVGSRLGLSWDEVEELFVTLQQPTTISDLKTLYGWSNSSKFKAKYVTPLIEAQLVCMTHPDKPTSPNQRYLLTENGELLLANETKTTDAEENVPQFGIK